ncbi:MAG: hypothetical protein JW981_01920, partial [Anaerolineae bacterium]|nr:hypothetical protein [Anaerolineae bacterium]
MRLKKLSLVMLLVLGLLASSLTNYKAGYAKAGDEWWDESWPYRIPVTVSGSGVAEVTIDFNAALAQVGRDSALLDLRSVRIIPYAGATAGEAIPYAETYSTLVEDGESPQIGWSASGVYWSVNDGEAEHDTTKASQGTGSVKATIINEAGGYDYPGVELRIASGDPLNDWHAYESFIYDVWPEVNASALDQAPDLYSFKLYNTNGCDNSNITQGGP